MRKQIIDLILLIVASVYVILFMVKIFNTDNMIIKHVIIKNSDKIYKIYDNVFKIDPYKHWYFTDATIRFIDDSCYQVVLWGKRDSKYWWLLGDHAFSIDVPYNESRKIDVSKDREILKILHNLNKQEIKTIDKHKKRVNELVDYYFSILENLIN